MPSKKPPPIPAPTPLEIATLAARFLPPIDLAGIGPHEKGAWHPDLIKAAIGELTSGKGRNFSNDYQRLEGHPTPFEVIAEEAVKRARVLLNAAAGKTRQAVLDYRREGEAAQVSIRKRLEAEEQMRLSDFERLAIGRAAIPLDEVLKFALPRVYAHRPENAWLHLREYFASAVRELRKKHDRPDLPITFVDCATDEEKSHAVDSMSWEGPPALIVLPHGPHYEVGRLEFPALVMNLRNFYGQRGEADRKRRERDGRRGGRKVQAGLRKGKITRAEAAALERVARKAKNPPPGA